MQFSSTLERDNKSLVASCNELIASPDELVQTLASNEAIKKWMISCPDIEAMKQLCLLWHKDNAVVKCDYCSEDKLWKQLRQTPLDEDIFHSTNGMCRDCWYENIYGKWPEKRSEEKEIEVWPEAYIYLEDKRIGEVDNYFPSRNWGHKVTLYGMESCAEGGPLWPGTTIRQTKSGEKVECKVVGGSLEPVMILGKMMNPIVSFDLIV